MKHIRILSVAIVALAFVAPAVAKTTTWKGGAGTSASPEDFSDGDNWDNGAPEPGDTVVLAKKNLYLTNADSFDIGSAGLAINASQQTYFKFGFTGSGTLSFIGNAQCVIQAVSTHTGGTVVSNGYLNCSSGNPNPLGTGDITLVQKNATRPYIKVSASEKTFSNRLVLQGDPAIENWTIFDSDFGKSFDSIESDHDFTIKCSDRGLVVNNGISAPGKTVTFQVSNTKPFSSLKHETDVYGAIDANVVVKTNTTSDAHSIVRLLGASTVVTNSMTVESGTLRFPNADGSWAGTNITVGASGVLDIYAAGNLSPAAHLTVAEGGTIKVASGVAVQISSLSVGGKVLLPGIYTASMLPGTISGEGKLLVFGDDVFVWTGADADNPTEWSVAANWQGNVVPGDGAVVYFPTDAVVSNNAESVTIGSHGLTFVLEGTVDLRDPLAGAGALTVTGTGQLNLDDPATHTGGTTLGGSAKIGLYSAVYPLGTTGVVTIDGSSGSPCLIATVWATTLQNDFVIHGAITNNTYGFIDIKNKTTFNGSITGDDDILIYNRCGEAALNGNVTVPDGKSIRVASNYSGDTASRRFNVNGSLSGNLSVEGKWKVKLNSNARCTGDVAVRNTATLELTKSANLSEMASLSLATGAKLYLASGVKQHVSTFKIGDVVQLDGTYTKDNCSSIEGDGVLRVGPRQGLVISFR